MKPQIRKCGDFWVLRYKYFSVLFFGQRIARFEPGFAEEIYPRFEDCINNLYWLYKHAKIDRRN